MRNASPAVALVWGALPLIVALCDAWPRSLAACDAPQTPLAIRTCQEGPLALGGVARLLFGEGLDPNDASAEDLALMPGIGPARAAAIIAERERGPFRRPRDLERVRGIGPRTVERLRPWLQTDPFVADPQGPSLSPGVR